MTRKEKNKKIVKTIRTSTDPTLKEYQAQLGTVDKWDDKMVDLMINYISELEKETQKIRLSSEKPGAFRMKQNFAYDKNYTAAQIKFASSFAKSFKPTKP
jgi:hypothetical protein